jgi:hypothetical protein
MAICSCSSPACCCQPAVVEGFIYADLRSEPNTHLAPQALFTQSSPGHQPLLQAFPFPSTLVEVTLHSLSPAGMFIYSLCWKWAFFPLLWSFPPPTATFTSFPAPGCSACAAAPAFSSRLVYLQFCEGLPLPPFLVLRAPCPLCYVSFCCYCLLFSFSFFPGWGSVCPGGYADLAQCCLWEFCMPLSSPCGLLLPKRPGHWHLAVRAPSWFLCLT